MDLVTTTAVFNMDVPMTEIITKLAAIGFTKLDLAFDYCVKNEFISDNWEKWVYDITECMAKNNVTFYQAHGIGNIKEMYEKKEDPKLSYRALKISSMLGIKYIIMHPFDTDFGVYQIPEQYIKDNAMWFAPYLEKCEELGIYLAIENLPWSNSSHADDLVQLIERLNSKYAGICWDTGHTHLLGQPVSEVSKTKGHLFTMHAHDNFADYRDDHMIPFDGTYDWKQFLLLLKDIGYNGEFSLEAHHQTLAAKNEEELQSLLTRLYDTGKYLCNEWSKI